MVCQGATIPRAVGTLLLSSAPYTFDLPVTILAFTGASKKEHAMRLLWVLQSCAAHPTKRLSRIQGFGLASLLACPLTHLAVWILARVALAELCQQLHLLASKTDGCCERWWRRLVSVRTGVIAGVVHYILKQMR